MKKFKRDNFYYIYRPIAVVLNSMYLMLTVNGALNGDGENKYIFFSNSAI